jgi:hypothetical protein
LREEQQQGRGRCCEQRADTPTTAAAAPTGHASGVFAFSVPNLFFETFSTWHQGYLVRAASCG